MEVDFDKEIDALLRKARQDGPVLVGDAKHLDADEFAAYAENALPEKSRGAYTLHLADCERCRKMLSSLVVMRPEAAVGAEPLGAITIAERGLPWYRKLFLFPNLAYVMGGLVLVLGGFLAFTVIQQMGGGGSAVVTQVADSEPRRGRPNFESEAPAESAASANSNAAANVGAIPQASNSNSVARPADAGVAGPNAGENFSTDGDLRAESSAGAPPPPPPAVTDMQTESKEVRGRELDKSKEETMNKAAGSAAAQAPAGPMKDDALAKLRAADAKSATQSGPMRNNESNYQRQLENMDGTPAAAAKRSVREDEQSSGRRAVAGRTFERKQGVWYDSAYQGRPTINVRRGSQEFNRLDGGLKSIANSLSGTVVVVWGAKAYRIQ